MERIVLDSFPFAPVAAEIAADAHVRPGSEAEAILVRLCAAAAPLGRPRALYGAAFIEERGPDFVVIDGVRFDSRILAVNLEPVHRVFPLVATCGPELDQWAASFSDDLERFLAEAVKGAGLKAALLAWEHDLRARFAPGRVSTMTPGSLPDWPITQQTALFKLLGGGTAIGVRLLDTMFMAPNITVSGIAFTSEHGFESCRLCPREKCPGRRAKYEPDAIRRYMRD